MSPVAIRTSPTFAPTSRVCSFPRPHPLGRADARLERSASRLSLAPSEHGQRRARLADGGQSVIENLRRKNDTLAEMSPEDSAFLCVSGPRSCAFPDPGVWARVQTLLKGQLAALVCSEAVVCRCADRLVKYRSNQHPTKMDKDR